MRHLHRRSGVGLIAEIDVGAAQARPPDGRLPTLGSYRRPELPAGQKPAPLLADPEWWQCRVHL